MEKFGESLRGAREASGQSAIALATAVGVSGQCVSRWELGQSVPCGDNLAKLRGLFPGLPHVVPTVESVSASRAKKNTGNWHGAKSNECPSTPTGKHKWWYSKSGMMRICDDCPAVERKEEQDGQATK